MPTRPMGWELPSLSGDHGKGGMGDESATGAEPRGGARLGVAVRRLSRERRQPKRPLAREVANRHLTRRRGVTHGDVS
jgi:hypothetical protein